MKKEYKAHVTVIILILIMIIIIHSFVQSFDSLIHSFILLDEQNIYPLNIIEDEEGIQGSCYCYNTRKNVSKDVRHIEDKTILMVDEILKK